jgi:hypothetical protein
MMPWTAYRAVDEKSVGERRAVMGAKGANGEQLAVTSDQQHRFAAGMPLQHSFFGQGGKRDALAEVRPGKP